MNKLSKLLSFFKDLSITLWVLLFIVISVVGTVITGMQAYTTSRAVMLDNAYRSNLNQVLKIKNYVARQNSNQSTSAIIADLQKLWVGTEKVYKGSYFFVINRKGEIILHTAFPLLIGRNIKNKKLNKESITTILQLIELKADWMGRYVSSSGENQIAAFTYSPELDAVLAVHVPFQEIEGLIRDTSLPWIIAMVIMGAVLMPILIWLLHRAYVNTQNQLKFANHTLNEEIGVRYRAESDLARHKYQLEELVAERTIALRSSNQELESFSYSVSHDLRSPLRSIDGFCNILLDEYEDKVDDPGKNYLHRIRAGVQHMGELIDDLLKLSRMNKAELERVQVDLSSMALSVFNKLKESEPKRNVELVVAPELSAYADVNLIESVLVNLIGNAWKYTEREKNAKIEIGCQHENDKEIFFVKDNGVGFDMRYADKLFGAFQRLHSVKDFPGTGIGLATVQRIILRHGGRIWANSEISEGAVFWFILPKKSHLQEIEKVNEKINDLIPIVKIEKWKENNTIVNNNN